MQPLPRKINKSENMILIQQKVQKYTYKSSIYRYRIKCTSSIKYITIIFINLFAFPEARLGRRCFCKWRPGSGQHETGSLNGFPPTWHDPHGRVGAAVSAEPKSAGTFRAHSILFYNFILIIICARAP